jgi:hypothetical protein
MKKISLVVLFSILSTFAFSQGISIGPKVGVNFSNYTGGNIKSDALLGYHLGGFISFNAGRNFAVQPEVLFSTQGAKLDRGTQKDTKFKTNYVSIPVMLKFKTNGGLYLELGPQVAFKTGDDIADQTINKFAKNLDLSLGGGIGYQTNFGLGIGARYMAGITKVGDFDSNTISNLDPDFKNSIIQLSLFFAIGGKN